MGRLASRFIVSTACPQCHQPVEPPAVQCGQCGYDLGQSFLAVARGVVHPTKPLLPGADRWRRPAEPVTSAALPSTGVAAPSVIPSPVVLAPVVLTPVVLASTSLPNATIVADHPIEIDDADLNFDDAVEMVEAAELSAEDEEAALDRKLAEISATFQPVARTPLQVIPKEPEEAPPLVASEAAVTAEADAPKPVEPAAEVELAPVSMPSAFVAAALEPSSPEVAVPADQAEAVAAPQAPAQEAGRVAAGAVSRANYAPAWRRWLATFLDVIPPAAVGALALFLVGAKLDAVHTPWIPLRGQDAADWFWTLGVPLAPMVALSPFIAGWLYQTVSFAFLGGTLGDRVAGIVWLTKHGRRPGWFRQLWRAVLLLPSWLLFGAGYWFLFAIRTHRPFYDAFIGIHPVERKSCEFAASAGPAEPPSTTDSDQSANMANAHMAALSADDDAPYLMGPSEAPSAADGS